MQGEIQCPPRRAPSARPDVAFRPSTTPTTRPSSAHLAVAERRALPSSGLRARRGRRARRLGPPTRARAHHRVAVEAAHRRLRPRRAPDRRRDERRRGAGRLHRARRVAGHRSRHRRQRPPPRRPRRAPTRAVRAPRRSLGRERQHAAPSGRGSHDPQQRRRSRSERSHRRRLPPSVGPGDRAPHPRKHRAVGGRLARTGLEYAGAPPGSRLPWRDVAELHPAVALLVVTTTRALGCAGRAAADPARRAARRGPQLAGAARGVCGR